MRVRCGVCSLVYFARDGHKCKGRPEAAAPAPNPQEPNSPQGGKAINPVAPQPRTQPKAQAKAKRSAPLGSRRLPANPHSKAKAHQKPLAHALTHADKAALAHEGAKEGEKSDGGSIASRVRRWRENHPDEWRAIHREQERKRRARQKAVEPA